MNANNFLEKLLGIASPSHISKLQLVSKNNTLHIWVRSNKGFFDRTGSLSCPDCKEASGNKYAIHDLTWHHLKVGQYNTEIHASVPIYKKNCGLKNCNMTKHWLAPAKLKLSYALSHEIIELISNDVSYSAICKYFNIPLDEVWAVKHQFETGNLKIDTGKIASSKKKKTEIPTIEVTDDILPPSSDMVWHKLLEGGSSFATDSLSLKFMLTRVKGRLAVMPDEESRRIKINELRQFFLKHERVLGKEISQILEMSNER